MRFSKKPAREHERDRRTDWTIC